MTMITARCLPVTRVLLAVACVLASEASSQTLSSPDLSWAGWAQCQMTIQAPGYSHREAHRWTIIGGLTKNGNMEVYPATWSVTGDGSLQRVDGPSAQWKVNGTLGNVEIGVTRH